MWYNNISKALEDIGYVKNEYDKCVFNKMDANGVQISIALHVDDLLVTSTSDALIEELENHLRSRYGTITVKGGDVIDYVGMTFDFREQGKVKVSMKHCVEDILSTCGVEGTAATPAGGHLFVGLHRRTQMVSYARG